MVRLKDFEQWNDSYAIKGYNPDLRSTLLKELKHLSKRISESDDSELGKHNRLLDKGAFIWLVSFINATPEELEVQE